METHGVGHARPGTYVPATPGDAGPVTAASGAPEGGVPTGEPGSLAADADGAKVKGVVRNLLAGHFKGVADVRLRINFAEELAAAQAQARAPVAAQKVGELAVALDGAVGDIAEGPELTGDQREDIDGALRAYQVAVSALADGTTDPEAIRDGAQAAFDALTAALADVLAPEPPPDVEPDLPIVAAAEDLPASDEPPTFDPAFQVPCSRSQARSSANSGSRSRSAVLRDLRACPERSRGGETPYPNSTSVLSARSRFSAANWTAPATSGKPNRCVIRGMGSTRPEPSRLTAGPNSPA